ncbi:hypothetical protein SAMN05216604_107184 [Pseudomonas agarici]|nr:hypothetical protein SAMN05216604_107184 [Pseudomonas agarici]
MVYEKPFAFLSAILLLIQSARDTRVCAKANVFFATQALYEMYLRSPIWR